MPDAQEVDLQVQLLEDIAEFTHDPLGFVTYAYDWGERDLEGSSGPYKWQAEIFTIIGEHLSNPKTRFTPLRIAVASGHGIGKSAFVAMLDDWAMSTHEDCKVMITAGTGTQLQTKTQPEISKWYRLSINGHWFDVKAKSITSKDEKHSETWRTDLITWNESTPDTFQGLHNKGKRIVVIFDEASAVGDNIWDTIQGALTDENTEIIFIVFGNPIRNQGRFFECFGSDKARWETRQIDSRTVEGTNKKELQSWVEKYGEDSDYIRVRVRGEFPRAGTSQFIPSDVVAACRRAVARGYESMPKILTCDVARYGDDETVIGLRQGRRFQILKSGRGWDTVKTTDNVVDCIQQHAPDAIVVDGDGIGGAVVDGLKSLGYKAPNYLVHEFHGGAAPLDPNMYFNKRTEVWGWMRDWLAAGAQIPDEPDMERQLTAPMFDIVRGKVQHGSIFLEHKEDLKKRGYESPDKADTLAMSFAVKVAPKSKPDSKPSRAATSWS